LVGLLVLGGSSLLAPVQAEPMRNVLMIYSSTRLAVANNDVSLGIRKRVLDADLPKARIFEEYLDQGAFGGAAFEGTVEAYLRTKYSRYPPAVLIAAGATSLEFLLRHRATLFPGVPVVHVGVEEARIREIGAMPADVLGSPPVFDVAGSIRLAFRLHPKAKRLIVVTGAGVRDRQWENDTRAVLAQIPDSPRVEFWAGLPTTELIERLHRLDGGSGDVVFTPGFFTDGAGRNMLALEAGQIIAAESRAPVYGPFVAFIGIGFVGGGTVDFIALGRQAGDTVNALLGGAAPATLRTPAAVATPAEVDWRQLRRWDISESALPQGTIVRFKEATLWEQYRQTVLVALMVFALQAALIAALLLERRRSRATATALEESEQRMSLAARAAGLTTWIWDAARDAVRSHPLRPQPAGAFAEAATGFDRVLETVHPADRESLDRAVRGAAANREELDVEYRVLQPDGGVRWIAARGRTAANDDSQLTGVAMDVTARKVAELQAERDRAALTHMTRVSTMGQLSASIAHQLNQPLAAILGNAEVARKMLRREPLDLAELGEICDDIVAQDLRATEIIGRLSALFRRGDMKFVRFDLNAFILETLELMRTELLVRHVTPVVELTPAWPQVDGDRVQLQQVLLNIVMNAADAMKDTDVGRRRIVIRTELEGDFCRLCIADNGTGIPPEEIRNVFAAFWSTKGAGVGVGLAVSQSIVNAHQGTLTVVNNPEGGATFCVAWPVQRPVER
jgi:C4-dicarboxylate-specific signal transduction histidine kinase